MMKKMYVTPKMEALKLEEMNLLSGSGEDPEQYGTSDNPYSGEGL